MPRNRGMLASLLTLSVFIAGPATSQEVATTYDEERISLSGTVDTVLATSFVLDCGENAITVELDQFDWDVEKSELQGEKVKATGRMDRNLCQSRSIEAAIVYVPAQNEQIYANRGDEDGNPSMTRSFAPELFLPAGAQDGDWLSFSGRVTAIEGDEIMADTADPTLRVDTSLIPGAIDVPEVSAGDRVLVNGVMDSAGLFGRREVEATSVTRLPDAG